MKLLRDFFRLRAPRRSQVSARRDAQRRHYVVTVPAPLVPPATAPQRAADVRQANTVAPSTSASPRHFRLASSH